MIRAEAQAADTAESVRRVMRVISTEVTDCPRLFTLTPYRPSGIRRAGVHQDHYRLTLWCEHPGYGIRGPQRAIELTPPKEWFSTILPYAVLIIKTLQLVVPLAGSIAVASLPTEQMERAEARLEVMKTLVDDLPGETRSKNWATSTSGASGPLTPAEGQALRAIRAIIFENDRLRRWGAPPCSRPSGEFCGL